ncbi:hypothetical protein [Rhizobium sp. Root483D2]|uniref:hypothetical protein n=1 Tax=Rhizobium sp. Root483D2 TaxID=1736545 RepID=UPI000AAA859E|nr:hypothetical protein [Rhizobium sp. Root483D2]
MAIEENLVDQIDEAMILAGLHRTSALQLIDEAQAKSHKEALLKADEAFEGSERALIGYLGVLPLLPDLDAAVKAKLEADFTLIISRSALLAARYKLDKPAP